MNIISNCCAGAEFYKKVLNVKCFPNPFIWASVCPDDIKELIKNYNKINFDNYKIFNEKDNKNKFYILVDNKIKLHFTHHIYSQKYTKPTYIDADCYYNKMEDYILTKYKQRIEVMKKENSKPNFLILTDRERNTFTINDVNDVININTDYKIIICSPNEIKTTNKNILTIKGNTLNHIEIIVNNKEKILNFINS